MNQPPVYEIRDYDGETDDCLVFDSWTKACRFSCVPQLRWPGEMRRIHRQLISDLLANCPAKVAAIPGNPRVIYGWGCGGLLPDSGLQVLHMLYVRAGWRERGIGTALLKSLLPAVGDSEIYYTHRTQGALKWGKRHKGIWNPYLLQELV